MELSRATALTALVLIVLLCAGYIAGERAELEPRPQDISSAASRS